MFLAGGDLEEVMTQQKKLEEMATLAGCSAIVLTGRRGWVRALEKLGWEYSHTTAFYKVKDNG